MIVIPIAVTIVVGSMKSLPIIAKATAIFTIDDKEDPSLCKFAPNGITTLATLSFIPICFAAIKLTGITAMLLQVLTAVAAGKILFLQKTLTPYLPYAKNA